MCWGDRRGEASYFRELGLDWAPCGVSRSPEACRHPPTTGWEDRKSLYVIDTAVCNLCVALTPPLLPTRTFLIPAPLQEGAGSWQWIPTLLRLQGPYISIFRGSPIRKCFYVSNLPLSCCMHLYWAFRETETLLRKWPSR